MSVYQRYASGEANYLDQPELCDHPESNTHFPSNSKVKNNSSPGTDDDLIIIFPLSGRLELTKNSEFKSKTTEEWINIFPNAAYFCGYDESLFGHFVIAVYENPLTEKICTVSITKFGVTLYHDLILNHQSRFYPSCENLLPIHRESKVRKALAITNLKNYNKLVNHPGDFQINKRWDETNAGYLASKMNLLIDKRPNEFGIKLLQMGLIQNHSIKSYLLDIVYDNSSNGLKTIEDNNKLVYLLGDQLDQLFDPLLEYSPEKLETSYNTPNPANYETPILTGNETLSAISNELFTIQTNFTMGLVDLLQNFIIPLRIHILTNTDLNSSADKVNSNRGITSGISKINQVFPPTIDEITRINCVLHDSLTKARPFGYIEIIKVFGMILPYFYKPFIRHEANLKSFKSRFNKFYGKYDKKVFNNANINRNNFSKNYIDSIITGSLLELPRIKLVLVRLYDNIKKELGKLNRVNESQEELAIIDYYFNTSINIINAFGGEENEISQQHENHDKGHERFNSRQRIFTPTGKILTELASNWPPELQYGWITRKVIGIFELKNVKPNNEFYHDNEILIIFSDNLLFLRIVDDKYYIKENIDDSLNFLSIPDVLMHSLVNEKPLPTLSQFPAMEVSYWCPINDINVTTYKSFSFLTSSEENFLRFFDYTGNGFKGDLTNELSKNYEILSNDRKNVTSGHEIVQLINKAKILNKSQPFHLFRSNVSNLHVYSTAHNALNYDNEQIKSQIILLLNLSQEMVQHYFQVNEHLFLIFTACFTYDRNIQLIAFSRGGGVEVNVIVPENEFQNALVSHLSRLLNAYYNSFTSFTELMIKSNHVDLEYYLLQYQRFNSFENREKMRTRVNSENSRTKKNLESETIGEMEQQVQDFDKTIDLDKLDTELVKEQNSSNQSEKCERKKKGPQNDNEQKRGSIVESKKVKPKRKSFIKRLFGSLKKSSNDNNVPEWNKQAERPVENEMEIENSQNQTGQYKELYRPNPKLKKADSPEFETKSTMQEDVNAQEELLERHENLEIDPESTNNDAEVSHVLYHKLNDSVDLQTVHHFKQQSDDYSKQNDFFTYDGGQNNHENLKHDHNHEDNGTSSATTKPFKELFDTSEEDLDYSRSVNLQEPQNNTIKEQVIKQEEKDPQQEIQKESGIHTQTLQAQPLFQSRQTKQAGSQSHAQLQAQAIAQAQLLFRNARQKMQPSQLQQKKQIEFTPDVKANQSKQSNDKQHNETVDKKREPSLEVNSQFHFPSKEDPMNAINMKFMNRNEISIRDVSDSEFHPELISQIILDENEANWVPASRNSSSSSISIDNTEYKTNNTVQIENISDSYHYDTSLNSKGEANFANKIRDISAADSYKSQIVFFNNKINDDVKQFKEKDESVQSLTPSQYADQFSREIDMNFSSSGLKQEDELSLSTNTLQEIIYAGSDATGNTKKENNNELAIHSGADKSDAHETAKRFSGMTHTSSEEEYYSLDEYPGSPIKTKSNSNSPIFPVTPVTPNHGSFSSENTIINLQEDPSSTTNGKSYSMNTATNLEHNLGANMKTLNNDIYAHQFDSMAYLSDVLNGKVKFDD